MSDQPSSAWMEKYRETVNGDPEMAVTGDWSTVDFKILFEGNVFLIPVREGKIASCPSPWARRRPGSPADIYD